MSVCVECCVLSGRGLCDGLITRPEKSYRPWCVIVCDLETSRMRKPWPALGRSATGKKNPANNKKPSEISDFHCGVTEWSRLGCYTLYVGGYLPTFLDSLSVPSSRRRSPTPFPQSRVLEKLTLPKINNICTAFLWKRRFITVSTTARSLSKYWARSIQNPYSYQMLISVRST